ncbi:hypothetical protein M231_00103 [Tremella mesenterica]|uniref:Flavin reductase like domain-containing protein n=1 Tax=Tremella mesenterica TaxID=5217 RepID=A0A4Q1BWK2_TREME|nr:hypothetical protein M231_00103 [Tremella mesenterica]
MSYFNMVANDPPAIVISVAMNPGGKGLKDTAVNIKETGEFTLNIISEPFLEAANYTSIDAPRDIDEWKLSGLTQHKSDLVKPPYVGESAVSLECTLLHSHELSGKGGNLTHTIMIGKIERIHVKETVLNDDKEQPVVIPEKLKPVSRLGGITFGRAVQFMEVPRPSWEAVKDTEEVVQALAGEVKTV